MVAMYNIAGRQIGSHWLAIATLTTVFGGSFAYAKSGPAKQTNTPPINASSKDEEKFIQEFIQSMEAEEKKSKAAH